MITPDSTVQTIFGHIFPSRNVVSQPKVTLDSQKVVSVLKNISKIDINIIKRPNSSQFPRCSYGFPMVFLWFSYGFPRFSYGFPMVFLRF